MTSDADMVRVHYPSGSVWDMPRRRAAIALKGNPFARIVELPKSAAVPKPAAKRR